MREVNLIGNIELPNDLTGVINASARSNYGEFGAIPAMTVVMPQNDTTLHIMDTYNLYPCCALRGAYYDSENSRMRTRYLISASSNKTAKFKFYRIMTTGEVLEPMLYDSEYAKPVVEYLVESFGYSISGILNVPCQPNEYVTVRIAVEEYDKYDNRIGCIMYSRQCTFYIEGDGEYPVAELREILPFEEEGNKYHVNAIFIGRWINTENFYKHALGDSYGLQSMPIGFNSHYCVVQYIHGVPRQVLTDDFFTGGGTVKIPEWESDVDRGKVLTIAEDREKIEDYIDVVLPQTVTVNLFPVVCEVENIDLFVPGALVRIIINDVEYEETTVFKGSEEENDYVATVSDGNIIYSFSRLGDDGLVFVGRDFSTPTPTTVPGVFYVNVETPKYGTSPSWESPKVAYIEVTEEEGVATLHCTYNELDNMVKNGCFCVMIYKGDNVSYVGYINEYGFDDIGNVYYVIFSNAEFTAEDPDVNMTYPDIQ